MKCVHHATSILMLGSAKICPEKPRTHKENKRNLQLEATIFSKKELFGAHIIFLRHTMSKFPLKHDWLVVELTHLKNIKSKWESSPSRGEVKKNETTT